MRLARKRTSLFGSIDEEYFHCRAVIAVVVFGGHALTVLEEAGLPREVRWGHWKARHLGP